MDVASAPLPSAAKSVAATVTAAGGEMGPSSSSVCTASNVDIVLSASLARAGQRHVVWSVGFVRKVAAPKAEGAQIVAQEATASGIFDKYTTY